MLERSMTEDLARATRISSESISPHVDVLIFDPCDLSDRAPSKLSKPLERQNEDLPGVFKLDTIWTVLLKFLYNSCMVISLEVSSKQ